MELNEFINSIPSYVDLAVTMGKKLNGGNYEITTSIKDITQIDAVVSYLHNLWEKKLINDDVAWNASVAFGVVLGEMMNNEHDYHWIIEDNLPMISTDDNTKASPITKMYKIITDEDNCEGTASDFYEGFMALLEIQNMSDEEKERITTYVKQE